MFKADIKKALLMIHSLTMLFCLYYINMEIMNHFKSSSELGKKVIIYILISKYSIERMLSSFIMPGLTTNCRTS